MELTNEKQSLLKETKKRKSYVKTTLVFLFAALLVALFSFPQVLIKFKSDVLRYAGWNKFTAVGLSVINEKYHFVWKEVYDHESNSFKVDAFFLKKKDDEFLTPEDLRVQAVSNYLLGNTAMPDLKGLNVLGPYTAVFTEGDLYGVYPKEGKVACRHYVHEMNLPEYDPLEGATNHGVEYVHKLVYADKYTELNFPTAPGQPKARDAVLWVESFSQKPLAAKYSVTVEKFGKTFDINAFHHFFKFYSWVDSTQLTIPESIKELCYDVGGIDELMDKEILDEVAEPLMQLFSTTHF